MITFLLLSFNAFGQEQIRIMSYDILNYPNVPGNDSIMVANTTGRNPYLRTIFSSVNPDIALLQEMERGVDATAFLTNVMNSYGETYEMGWHGTAGDNNPIYFKADKFNLISSYLVIDQARVILQLNTFSTMSKPGILSLFLILISQPDRIVRIGQLEKLMLIQFGQGPVLTQTVRIL